MGRLGEVTGGSSSHKRAEIETLRDAIEKGQVLVKVRECNREVRVRVQNIT
jgi:hypothetical protein